MKKNTREGISVSSVYKRSEYPVYKKRYLCIALLTAVVLILASCGRLSGNPYFKVSDDEYDIMQNLLYVQDEADAKISEEMKDNSHTLEDPLVLENPYDIAPLTALIIFNTEEATFIDLTVNGGDPVRFEKSKEHAIPVYGLFDGFDNKLLIKDEHGNSKELSIKTEKYEGGVIDVEKTSKDLSDEFFMVSPDYERTSAYDKTGKLLWYLDTKDNEGAMKFLGDSRFLISDPFQGSGGIRINYSGFMNMDYLGKVHKLYLGEYGYHHEIVIADGGKTFIIPGHDEESPFMQAVVYSVDRDTMKTGKKVDFYEVFMKEAPAWTKDLLKDGKFNFVVNGIDYDGETGDVIASIRSLGMLIRINMNTSEIKWIFADPKNVPDDMKKYLLEPSDDTRYPYGQHEPVFLPDGNISYHNNDVDFLLTDLSLANLKGHYSSNEVIKVDEEGKKVSTVWTHDGNKNIISRMSGSFEFLPGGHKLVSYGSAVRIDEVDDPKTFIIADPENTEALMMELDKDDKVVWQATFPSIIHKVYRSTFYGEEGDESGDLVVPNYKVEPFEEVNGEDKESHMGEPFDVSEVSSELKSAGKLDGDFSLMINRGVLDYDLEEKDEVKLLFIDEKEKGTVFTYKKKDEALPIINSGQYGIRIAGLTGRQKAYVSIGGKWYDTGKIFTF